MDNTSENALQIDIDASGGELVVAVGGEIDPYTSPQLEAELNRATTDKPVDRVVVDLGGVGFLDSSGLRVLITAHQHLAADGRSLVLRNLRPNTRQLFEITQLADEMNLE